MRTLNISQVRNDLPSVVEKVARFNEVVVVTRYGKPIASIVPYKVRRTPEDRYPLRGQPIVVAEDFDEPMPELWAALAVAERSGDYVSGKVRRPRSGKTSGRK